MKTFVVLSCLVAVACGAGIYQGAGGFGSQRFGSASRQQQQSSHVESHQSSQSVSGASSSAVGGSSGFLGGGGGIVGDSLGVGSGLGGYSSDLAGGAYDSSYVGGGASSALHGSSSSLIGGGHGLVGGSPGFVGTGTGLDSGYNSLNAGGFSSRQSQTSVSKSFHHSSSSSSSSYQHAAVDYANEWGDLYKVPFFDRLCNFKSNMRSAELASNYLDRSVDYGSVFSNIYSRNHLLQKYFSMATGIRYGEQQRSSYFGLIKQNPVQALRIASIFARNPGIFQSPFGQFVCGGTSNDVLQQYQNSYSSTYTSTYLERSRFIESLTRSRYYSRSLSRVFGLQSYDSSILLSKINQVYSQNPYGTILLLRHVLARRQLYGINTYLGCNSYNLYRQQTGNIWNNRSWRHNSYISSWKQISSRSSFSQYSSQSRSSLARSSSSAGIASAGGYGVGGIDGYGY